MEKLLPGRPQTGRVPRQVVENHHCHPRRRAQLLDVPPPAPASTPGLSAGDPRILQSVTG